MNKKILILAGVALVATVSLATYQYNKPHRDIANEEATYRLTADDIYSEFVQDQSAAYEKYNDQVVAFSGVVSNVKQADGVYHLLIQGKEGLISCEMDSASGDIPSEGQAVQLKGIFVGFDDLLGELQFKKCSIVD